ncbi:MAG: hypothetical protein NWS69_08890 [Pseudomonadales bacterium]|nr:hypothetical protein [Pseudomonadales bacterium]
MKWLLNIASNYLRFIAALLVMALMTPYMIRTIGVDMYGLWILVYSAIGLIGLSDLGFATAAVKFIAEQSAPEQATRRNELVGSLLLTYSAIGIFCAVIVLGLDALDWVPGGISVGRDIFLLLGLTTALCMVFSVFRAVIIASGQQALLNVVTLVVIVSQALATWILLESGYGIMGLAWASCLGMLLQALVCIPMCWHLLEDFSPRLSDQWRQDIRRIANFSVWAFLANGAFLLVLRIDPFIVEAWLTLEAVAVLAIALKIAEQILLFNKQFSNALMPLISQQHGRGEVAEPAQVFKLGTKYLLAFAAPFTLLTAVSAGSLIQTWVGNDMVAAAPLLQILCVASLLSTMQFNAANLLGMTGHARYVGLSMLGSAATKILVTLLAFHYLGMLACAVGTLLGAALFECFANLRKACQLSGESLPMFLWRAIAPGIISCLPFVNISHTLNQASQHSLDLPMLLVVNGLAGLASLLVFYGFFVTKDERQWLHSLVRKPAPITKTQETSPCQLSTNL